jgi:hypothetical protein
MHITIPPHLFKLKPEHQAYLTDTLRNPILPILNNWGLIVATVGRGPMPGDVAFAVELKYRFAKVEAIHDLHQFFISHHGYNPNVFPVSITADGKCNAQAKAAGHCHPIFGAKDTCHGCGKSWLAGSYNQPSRCKPQLPSQWQTNNSDFIRRHIGEHGVSKTGPLVTTQYGGVTRIEPSRK